MAKKMEVSDMTDEIRMEKKRKNYIILTNAVVFAGCFILLSSMWIRKNYGVFALAVIDRSFRNFLQNKRSVFLVQVCVPVVCIFLMCLFVGILLLKKGYKWPYKQVLLLGIMFSLASVLLGGAYLKVDKYVKNQIRKQGEQWYDDNAIVMHALGMVDGHTYTNSYEALNQNYSNGHRIFECDFVLTADNELVACHDWDRSEANGFQGIPTRQEFMEVKILGKYTPMSIEDIIQFMEKHTDVYLITDTKSAEAEYYTIQFQKIVDTAKKNDCEDVLDRFVIQIYHPYMYIDINAIYPFDNWIFTLYQEAYRGQVDQMEEYAKFCVTSGIDVITMNKDYYSDDLLEVCDRYGLRLFVHTVKDEGQKQEFLSKNVGIYVNE